MYFQALCASWAGKYRAGGKDALPCEYRVRCDSRDLGGSARDLGGSAGRARAYIKRGRHLRY